MCNANFLVHLESFTWADFTIDRSVQLDSLALAFVEIQNHPDDLFAHPEGYNIPIEGIGFFHEMIYADEETRSVFEFSWLTHSHQKLLIALFDRNTTRQKALNLEQLESEFPNQNNGLLGLEQYREVNKLVYDDLSWKKFHQDYAWINHLWLRIDCIDYFDRFYVPKLTISANQIRQLIRSNQAHLIFHRLDIPSLEDGEPVHGQQVHMHFSDPSQSALNIDGTWKHGGFEIPQAACEKLIEWGFRLP